MQKTMDEGGRDCESNVRALVGLLILASAATLQAAEPVRQTEFVDVSVREGDPVKLELVSRLPPGPLKENSGIVRSRQFDDLFWMHNDSGDEPRVYPIRRNGASYKSTRESETPGVLIGGAINIDWEDITVDDQGNLIVADVGNNGNDRRDLALYFIPEPSPDASRAAFLKKVIVRYPDQTAYPATKDDFNYDCEGVFTVGRTVHLLTKNRSDTFTKLYRVDDLPSRIAWRWLRSASAPVAPIPLREMSTARCGVRPGQSMAIPLVGRPRLMGF